MSLNPVTEGMWHNSAEKYAYYRAFLLITEAGRRDITIFRDSGVNRFGKKYPIYLGQI